VVWVGDCAGGGADCGNDDSDTEGGGEGTCALMGSSIKILIFNIDLMIALSSESAESNCGKMHMIVNSRIKSYLYKSLKDTQCGRKEGSGLKHHGIEGAMACYSELYKSSVSLTRERPTRFKAVEMLSLTVRGWLTEVNLLTAKFNFNVHLVNIHLI